MKNQLHNGEPVARANWDTDQPKHLKPGLAAHIHAALLALNIPALGRNYVWQALQAPSRKVRSTPRSCSGSYPSQKMGVTIGFESRTLELPAITLLEHDCRVLGYLEQTPKIKVQYISRGRKRGYLQTPDFISIAAVRVSLIECKSLAQIHKRNQEDPDFYILEGNKWVCPPLQEAAAEYGFEHEVWTEETFHPTFMSNLRILSDYLAVDSNIHNYEDARSLIQAELRSTGHSSVANLIGKLRDSITMDHLYMAIAKLDVAFDIYTSSLVNPDRCVVYRDGETLKAFQSSSYASVSCERKIIAPILQVTCGTELSWDGSTWRCVNYGEKDVLLERDKTFETLPRQVFDQFFKSGVITSAMPDQGKTLNEEVQRIMGRASTNDLRTGNHRLWLIQPYLAPNSRSPSSRTIRRYLASYRNAERAYGNGFIGLLPGFSRSGNRSQRHIKDVLDIVIRQVQENYATPANRNAKTVYGFIVDECTSKSLPSPSYSWFCKALKKLPAYQTARSRKGTKGAYDLEPRQEGASSAKPEYAFARAHVDHTLLNLEMVYGETGENLGRCWLTVMIDHSSRRILAYYITFDPPSYRSVLMVMRKCVQRYARLPESIVIDGGKEFQSTYFEVVCALYKTTIIRRPISKSRFGSQIERFFGTLETNLIHILLGNTQLRKNVRQMTDEVDPDVHAVWTLPTLDKTINQYFYEVYELLDHRELLVTPRFSFEQSIRQHGRRINRLIAYDELFIILTSPTTDKGAAKVQCDGVKINYIYYNSPQLQRHFGKSVEVRYDPFDKSRAWAYVDRQWIHLQSRHSQLLNQFTEHDLELAATEWRKRRSDVEKARLSESVLINFLKEVQGTEAFLLAQRRAAEERRIRGEQYFEETASDDQRRPYQIDQTGPKVQVVEVKDDFAGLSDSDIELLEAM